MYARVDDVEIPNHDHDTEVSPRVPTEINAIPDRPRRDVHFARALTSSVFLVLLGGLVAASRAPRQASTLITSDVLRQYASCHSSSGVGERRRTLLDDGEDAAEVDVEAPYLVGVAVGAVVFGALALWVIKKHPRGMTWGMIYANVAVMVAMGVGLVASGGVLVGLIFLGIAAWFAWFMIATRDRVELVAKLLGAAASALNDNPHLVTVSTTAGFALIGAMLTFTACVVAASFNGAVAPNTYVTMVNDKCFYPDDMTTAVNCCRWETDAWVGPYMSFASLVALWTFFTIFEARTFIIGGTVSKWYFAPVGTTSFVGTTREFIGHAWGASSGSLAFGALVLAGVSILRRMNEQARRRHEGFMALLACIVTSIMDCVAELIETLTKFATIQCAISGEGLCDSGREVTRLLNDNFLSAVRVWWLPEMICNMAALVLAIAYSVFASFVVGVSTSIATGDGASTARSWAVALTAFFTSWIVLSFFFNILLVCVDAVFICYARDKDQNTLTKPEIIAIYDEVTEKTRSPLQTQAMRSGVTRGSTRTSNASSNPGHVFSQPGNASPMVYGRPLNDNNL